MDEEAERTEKKAEAVAWHMIFTLTGAYTYAIVSVVTTAILVIVLRHLSYDMGTKREIDTFRLFLIAFMIFVAANGVCVWANYNKVRLVGMIFTTINQTAVCTAGYFWLIYTETRLNPRRSEEDLFRYAMLIQMMSMVLLVGSSPITHLVFYYDENGEYFRGPLYPMLMLTSFIYLTVATVEGYRQVRYAKTKAQRRQIHYLMIFIIFPVIAGVIDFFHAHLPSMELIGLFGIILIYMNFQHEQVYRDALTGLNNRRMTDEYLNERVQFATEERPLYFFISDIDRFKSINDRFGHAEGDNALKIVAEVLKHFVEVEHYFISRWGGDEFVMIIDQDGSFVPEEFARSLGRALARATKENDLPYAINLSVGFVEVTDPETDVDEILNSADQCMYLNKRRNKDLLNR